MRDSWHLLYIWFQMICADLGENLATAIHRISRFPLNFGHCERTKEVTIKLPPFTLLGSNVLSPYQIPSAIHSALCFFTYFFPFFSTASSFYFCKILRICSCHFIPENTSSFPMTSSTALSTYELQRRRNGECFVVICFLVRSPNITASKY